MKFLISEDNDHKFNDIKAYILKIVPDAIIDRVTSAKAGVRLLKQDKKAYDYLIQDMQLPLMEDSPIDREGGIYVLNQLRRMESEVKVCVCSSSVKAGEIMNNYGFTNISFFTYNPMYDMTESFSEFIKG